MLHTQTQMPEAHLYYTHCVCNNNILCTTKREINHSYFKMFF